MFIDSATQQQDFYRGVRWFVFQCYIIACSPQQPSCKLFASTDAAKHLTHEQ